MTSPYGVSVGVDIPPAPLGSRCRTACTTRDHATLGQCLRAANLHTSQVDTTREKAWDAEVGAYRDARRQGVQPATTRLRDTHRALDASDRLGAPFDAGRPFG